MSELFQEIPNYFSWTRNILGHSSEVRTSGLLALEDQVEGAVSRAPLEEWYYQLLQLIIDGTDPEVLQELAADARRAIEADLDVRWSLWSNLILFISSRESKTNELLEFFEGVFIDQIHDETIRVALLPFLTAFPEFANDERCSHFRTHPLIVANLGLLHQAHLVSEDLLKAALDTQFQAFRTGYLRAFDLFTTGALLIQSGDSPRTIAERFQQIVGPKNVDYVPTTKADLMREYQRLVHHEAEPDLSKDEIARRLNLISGNPWIYGLKSHPTEGSDFA